MSFWDGKTVLLTGHTGFKGAWLGLWLTQLGAKVTGIALPPEDTPSFFDQLTLSEKLDHNIIDIRDREALAVAIKAADPDIVFHLAAQALVLKSYREPAATFDTNVMGTVNVLDALRDTSKRVACVVVTTDKVYHNREWEHGYRETDRLGGFDPYSASKAASEIAVSAYRTSFFGAQSPVRLASARAGNVIGGGDWAENRIVPDLMRALSKGEPLSLRSPKAVRPWQHVLEPLGGYMSLAEHLYEDEDPIFQDAFNFGPGSDAERTVQDLVEHALTLWDGSWEDASDPNAPHEASRLALTIDRARTCLNWSPRWDFDRTISETVSWYRDCIGAEAEAITAKTIEQIEAYQASAPLSRP